MYLCLQVLLVILVAGVSLVTADYPAAQKPQKAHAPPVEYAGPIVYSDESPPTIHFPPPPKVTVSYL